MRVMPLQPRSLQPKGQRMGLVGMLLRHYPRFHNWFRPIRHKRLHRAFESLHRLSECEGLGMSRVRDIPAPSQNKGRISRLASAVVFAILIGAIATYLYEAGTWNPIKHAVPDTEIQSPPLLHLPTQTPHPAPQ